MAVAPLVLHVAVTEPPIRVDTLLGERDRLQFGKAAGEVTVNVFVQVCVVDDSPVAMTLKL